MHQLRLGKRERPIAIHQKMPVRWRYVGDTCVPEGPLLGLFNLQGRSPAQDTGHQAPVAGIEVLHDAWQPENWPAERLIFG